MKANKIVNIYYPDTGQAMYERNRANYGPKFKFLSCSAFISFVEAKFYDDKHSIDAICGVAKLRKLFDNNKIVCTKTLYNYINLVLLGIANIKRTNTNDYYREEDTKRANSKGT